MMQTADIGVNGYQGVGDNCAPSAGPDRYADLKVEKLVEKVNRFISVGIIQQ